MQFSNDARADGLSHSRGVSRATWIAAAIVVAIATWAFAQSYGAWLDPIIDVGRDLYIPEQIREGTKLYRDIQYVYPPLTPYLFAVVTLLTGSSLGAYVSIGVAIAAVTALALFALVRTVSGSVVAATSASALFTALSFTGATSFGCNFVFPFAYAATLGTALTTCFAASLAAYLFDARTRFRLTAALAAGFLASWTKLEYALVVSVVLAGIWIVHRLDWRPLAAYVTLALLSVAAVSLIFHDSPPGGHWLHDNVLSSALLSGESATRFYQEVSGLARWQNSLDSALRGALLLVAIAAILAVLERVRERRVSRGVLLAVLALLSAAAAGTPMFRGWAILHLALVPFALTSERRKPLLLLLALSMLSTWRIFLRVSPEWYGFALIVPTYALLSYVCFEWLPAQGLYSRRTSLLWVPLFIATAVMGLYEQRLAYGARRYTVTTARGTFLDHREARAAALQELYQRLRAERPAGLVAIPEGLAVNYFADVANPTRFHMLTPPEAADLTIEQGIIADFERTKPAAVVIVPRDVREFGYTAWGVDYHVQLRSYLEAHYTIERRWTDPRFPMLLLRRR